MSEFKDFHKVENLHFDIPKLKKGLNEVLKIRNYDTANGISNFAAICLNQIPGDADSTRGHLDGLPDDISFEQGTFLLLSYPTPSPIQHR